jgi:integrase
MSRNLNSQLKYVINSSYYGDNNINRNGGHGSSKHSDKANGTKNGKIYSFNQKKNMISVAREFSNWMKEYHPEIRNVSELNERYAQEFVAYKSNEVGTTTLNYYRSSLNSIAESANGTFKSCNINLETKPLEGTSNEKVKIVSFTENDLKILKDSYQPESTGLKAIQIIESTGLRVHEVAQLKNSNIKIENGIATVHVEQGKGGRQRDVVVSKQEYVDTLQHIKDYSNEQIFTTKAHSIDQNIHRHIEKCDLSQNYNYNSCHSIRKYYAQETFNDYRKNGYSIEESAGKTIQNLGHSSSRLELTKTYIQNIH